MRPCLLNFDFDRSWTISDGLAAWLEAWCGVLAVGAAVKKKNLGTWLAAPDLVAAGGLVDDDTIAMDGIMYRCLTPAAQSAQTDRIEGCGLLPMACFLFYRGARLVAPLWSPFVSFACRVLQARFALPTLSNRMAGAGGQLN